MNLPAVLSLGSVNADFQVRIDGTPEFGATLLARDFCRLGGGKAANLAFARVSAGSTTLRELDRQAETSKAEYWEIPNEPKLDAAACEAEARWKALERDIAGEPVHAPHDAAVKIRAVFRLLESCGHPDREALYNRNLRDVLAWLEGGEAPPA